MIAISLGWGVQSFTLAAMSALGELPPVDVALHADTTHERQDTYSFAAKYTPWLESQGVRVVTVYNPQPDSELFSFKTDIPAFTERTGIKTIIEYDEDGDVIGQYEKYVSELGQLRRQCTGEWKIVPMRRWLQANRNGEPVEQWIGISTDEALRMKTSDVKYITHRWPLIEKRMSRGACINWLQSHGLEIPPKSACVFCPFHDTSAWKELKRRGGEDWRKAVEVDAKIRKVRPPYDLFIHPARIPLEQIDLRTAEQKGQMRLWDEECTGLCGV